MSNNAHFLRGICAALFIFSVLTIQAQASYEVVPVSGYTTFHLQVTNVLTDGSETVRISVASDSSAIRELISAEVKNNVIQTVVAENRLRDLRKEEVKLKKLYDAWHETNYNQAMAQQYKDIMYGTWSMRYDNARTLFSINKKLQVAEIGGNRTGKLRINEREIIVLRDFFGVGIDVVAYLDGEVYVFEYDGEKGILKKVSDDIKAQQR